jgi:prepilin peptidase CpaA
LAAASNLTFLVLVIGVATAAVIDIRTRRIPNELTAALAGLGLGLAATGVSGVSVGAAVAGMVVGFLLMLPGHALGATGAGDVKLMAAVGALLGPATVVNAFLFTALAGGGLAAVVALRRRRFVATIGGTGRLLAAPVDAPARIRSATPAHRFAYGPAIAIGSMLAPLVG